MSMKCYFNQQNILLREFVRFLEEDKSLPDQPYVKEYSRTPYDLFECIVRGYPIKPFLGLRGDKELRFSTRDDRVLLLRDIQKNNEILFDLTENDNVITVRKDFPHIPLSKILDTVEFLNWMDRYKGTSIKNKASRIANQIAKYPVSLVVFIGSKKEQEAVLDYWFDCKV